MFWLQAHPQAGGGGQAFSPVPHAGSPVRATVKRADAVGSTMLRKTATESREDAAWVDCRTCVRDGDNIVVLRTEGDFSWVRAGAVEGFIKSAYLHLFAVWEWERERDKWIVYSADITRKLEEGWEFGSRSVDVDSERFVDTKNMLQKRCAEAFDLI